MKNKKTVYAREQAKIYEAYYKPSFNLWRAFRAIFGVLIFGSSTVAQNYAPVTKKRLK